MNSAPPPQANYCLPRTFLLFCRNIFRLREGRPPELAGARGLSASAITSSGNYVAEAGEAAAENLADFSILPRAALISIGKMTKVLTSPLSSRNSHAVPVCRSSQALTQGFAVQTGCAGSGAFPGGGWAAAALYKQRLLGGAPAAEALRSLVKQPRSLALARRASPARCL